MPVTPSSTRILVVAGTRPECIKLAPVLHALRQRPGLQPILVNSGQHQQAVNAALAEFGLRADIVLPALATVHNLGSAFNALREALNSITHGCQPELVVVQGDTLTAYSGARAARDQRRPVAHVEAGLRTDQLTEPFPEEWFRRRIAGFADLHFTPSTSATRRLLDEGVDVSRIHQTGNTGIDSLRQLLAREPPGCDGLRNTVLVTLHRRSNCDDNAAIVCDALIDLARARHGLRVRFPVHPNPKVSVRIRRKLEAHLAFELLAPMRYREFIAAASGAALMISDSGGLQEEAPHLGTPLLVPRCNTERQESLATGFVELVSIERTAIVRAALRLLDAPRCRPLPIDAAAPYGDGYASERIVGVIEALLKRRAAA